METASHKAVGPLPQPSLPDPKTHTVYLFLMLCPCQIPWGIRVLLFIFLQSLKSDEEAESAKEPENELLETQGKAMA